MNALEALGNAGMVAMDSVSDWLARRFCAHRKLIHVHALEHDGCTLAPYSEGVICEDCGKWWKP